MKKPSLFILVIGMIGALLAGCSSTAGPASQSPQATAGGKISVVASFYAMADFAEKIGGDKISVTTLVPSGTEPHDWEPSAADIAQLEKAQVFIYNGAGMEHWVSDVLNTLANKNLVTVEASKGITLLEGHGEEGEEEDHSGEAVFDPHVWLNPMNAKTEMEAIKNALVTADPANKSTYDSNYQKYAAELDTLDQEFKQALSGLPNKDIVVAHEAFGYLCAAYGLNQVAIEGLTADSEPDPARMSDIIAFSQSHNVNVIFFEELVNPKVAKTIADAVHAKTEVLNPLEGLTDAQLKAGEDYFSVMHQNLSVLKDALK